MQGRMQGQPLPNLILPGHEYQIAILFRPPDENVSKVLRFNDHEAPAMLLHKPGCLIVSDQVGRQQIQFRQPHQNTGLYRLFLFLEPD
jgi:hypothetical protein